MQLTAQRGSYSSETNCNVTGNAYRESRRTPSSTAEHQIPAKTILFADDECSILTVRRLLFERLGYCVLTASSGTEALDLLRAHTVDAVVLYYTMSPMNGEEIARAVRRKDGETAIVLSSAYPSLPASILEVVDVLVEKGKGPLALIDALRHVLATGRQR